MSDTCSHLNSIQIVTPSASGCGECLTCGHVGCCDSSKNKHATKHFNSTEHPIVRSLEPGEDWRWCYIDKTFV